MILQGSYCILRQVLASFVKPPKQFKATDLKQFVSENICTLKNTAIYFRL